MFFSFQWVFLRISVYAYHKRYVYRLIHWNKREMCLDLIHEAKTTCRLTLLKFLTKRVFLLKRTKSRRKKVKQRKHQNENCREEMCTVDFRVLKWTVWNYCFFWRLTGSIWIISNSVGVFHSVNNSLLLKSQWRFCVIFGWKSGQILRIFFILCWWN